jgi:hypothetical protein
MPDQINKLQKRSADLLDAVIAVDKERQKSGNSASLFNVHDLASRGSQLIQSATGGKSSYAEQMRNALKQKSANAKFAAIAGVLQAFHLDLANGHLVNIRQEVEAVVVSEILSQAQKLSRTKSVHPAATVIVACAGAEEFLRNWCDLKGISVPEKQRSIARFAQELRTAGHIELPVERRICAWADYRNDAAHGANWAKITQEIANRTIREIEEFVLQNRHILG